MRAIERRRATAVIVVVALAVALGFAIVAAQSAAPDPSTQSASVVGDVPDDVAGWDAAQLENAAIVIRAGLDLGFGERDRTIAVMTAMGESSLTVLDHGDTAGPDSRGLFQQRDSWGPYEVRMDAYGSAVLFYQALGAVDGRDDLEPTLVAHTVQINQDPQHYADYWDDAVLVVEALAAADVEVVVSSA